MSWLPCLGLPELPRQLGGSLLKNRMQIRVCRARETSVLHLQGPLGKPWQPICSLCLSSFN